MASPGVTPVKVLKRKRQTDVLDLTLFVMSRQQCRTCESRVVCRKKQKFRSCWDTSKVGRHRLNPSSRLAETECESNSIHWHKSCYGSFTSKDHLKRLRKKQVSSQSEAGETSGRHRRVPVGSPFIWIRIGACFVKMTTVGKCTIWRRWPFLTKSWQWQNMT